MGIRIGYARVSSTGQDLTIQRERLLSVGCEQNRVYEEKWSGRSATDRVALREAISALREGDVFVATRVDRIAGSIVDLKSVVGQIEAAGASLEITEQNIDTTTAAGKCFLDMLGVFAEFETNLRHERQMEGIAKAKAKGKYKGRKPSIDADVVCQMKESGLSAAKIADELGISRSSAYRLMRA